MQPGGTDNIPDLSNVTGEDPRMRVTITARAAEQLHVYLVKADDAVVYEGEGRHEALQAYIGKRRELSDFATDPESYRVRFWCDGVEYLCDQESFPPRASKDRGKSCRQITGAVRPYSWERHIP